MSNRSNPLNKCCGNCDMDSEFGFCNGCYRTLDEIISWRTMSKSELKHVVKVLIPMRKQQAKAN